MNGQHTASVEDRQYQAAFEACAIAPGEFRHRDHVRLAYVYLCDADVAVAYERMRGALLAFLTHNGIDPAKYHETITHAWMRAVDYFMSKATPSASFDAFIAQDDRLLDPAIMLTHYSKAVLFSDDARAQVVEPDVQAIPPRRG